MPVRYLSTLSFADDWLAELRRRVPECEVAQLPADKVSDIPDELWRDVEVLHTSAVLPDPELVPALRWVQLDTSGVDHVRETALWHSDVEITTIGGVDMTRAISTTWRNARCSSVEIVRTAREEVTR